MLFALAFLLSTSRLIFSRFLGKLSNLLNDNLTTVSAIATPLEGGRDCVNNSHRLTAHLTAVRDNRGSTASLRAASFLASEFIRKS